MSILDQESPMMETSPNQGFWSGSPKAMFFMGLFLGLAIASTAALGTVLSMAWSGKTVLAAGNVAAPSVAPSADGNNNAPPPAVPAGPVKSADANDHVRGSKNAKVTLIEYSDFECPFCKRHDPTLKQALKDFPKDVRVVYRHYPLSFHQNAQSSAEASECAAKLGGNDKFWQYHDKLFDRSPQLGTDAYVAIAREIGLNEGNFKKCIDNRETKDRVESDAAGGNDAGVEGTPATFVNGKLVSGAIPYEGANGLKEAIKAAGAKE